jgi:hypothetical protein
LLSEGCFNSFANENVPASYLIVGHSHEHGPRTAFLHYGPPLTATVAGGASAQLSPYVPLTDPFDVWTVINLTALFTRLPK